MIGSTFENVKAVIFDVLHTLVDDSGFPRYQLKKMLREDGFEIEAAEFDEVYNVLTAREYDWVEAAAEVPFRTMKDRHISRLEALYSKLNLNEGRNISSDIELLWERIRTSNVYPEVSEVLPALQAGGYRLGLLSNADVDDPVLRVLYDAAIKVSFDVVVTSQGAGVYKPDRRIFERALLELELEAEDVIMVGDNPASDIMGAKRVGIPVIWVNRRGGEFPDRFPSPDASISDLRGLLDLLPTHSKSVTPAIITF